MDLPGLQVNVIAADDLVPPVAKASAAMILI